MTSLRDIIHKFLTKHEWYLYPHGQRELDDDVEAYIKELEEHMRTILPVADGGQMRDLVISEMLRFLRGEAKTP